MTFDLTAAADILGRAAPLVLVTLDLCRGSTPREEGAQMLVGADRTAGTIGGGQLELRAVDAARKMLILGVKRRRITMALGPELGQCCGGHVEIVLQWVSLAVRNKLIRRLTGEAESQTRIYVFGHGHVGRALAHTLAPLPFSLWLVDSRPDQFDGAPAKALCMTSAIPETQVLQAPPGSAFVVMTHDHAGDFLITKAALQRGDAAFVGMIGSQSKREKFKRYFLAEGGEEDALKRLTSPLASGQTDDKRPSVIAALAAAELVRCLLGQKQQAEAKMSPRRKRSEAS